MTVEGSTDDPSPQLSRRTLLRLAGGLGATAILAACGTAGGPSAPTAAPPLAPP